MKTKFSIRVICLIVALVVLGGTAAYAAVTGSPYETLKKAVLQAAAYTNVTIETEAVLKVNGVVEEIDRTFVIIGNNATLNVSYDKDGNESGYSYVTNGLSINGGSSFLSDDDLQWTYAYVSPTYQNYSARSYFGITADDLNTAQMRFFELAIDALVGDLKNNVTMSSENGIRTIQGTLTGSQLPPLANAAIDMFVEQSGRHYWDHNQIGFDGSYYVYENISITQGEKTVTRWREPARLMTAEEEQALFDDTLWKEYPELMHWGYRQFENDGPYYVMEGGSEIVSETKSPATRADYADRDLFDVPMSDISLNYIRGEAQIDGNGNLLYAKISGAATLTNIFGDVQEIEIDGFIRFTDIGTSNPVNPIPGAERLLTSENMDSLFNSQHVGVYFLLNDDGTIDESTMTTTHPGELARFGGTRYYSSSLSSYAPIAAPMPVIPLDPEPRVPPQVDEGDDGEPGEEHANIALLNSDPQTDDDDKSFDSETTDAQEDDE